MIPKFICDLCYKGVNERNNCGANIIYNNPFYCENCIIGGVPLEIDIIEGFLKFFYSDRKINLSKIKEDSELFFKLLRDEVESRKIIF